MPFKLLLIFFLVLNCLNASLYAQNISLERKFISYKTLDSLILNEYKQYNYSQAIAYTNIARNQAKLETKNNQDSLYLGYTSNLGVFYVKMNQYEKAEKLMLEVSDLLKKESQFPHSKLLITTLNNLGYLYNIQGHQIKAEKNYLETLKIRAKVFGKKSPEYALSLNNLGNLYTNMQRYSEAKNLFVEAINIFDNQPTPNPNRTLPINNLAKLYFKLNELDKSEKLMLSSKKIEEEKTNKNYADLALSINNLASLYEKKKAYKKAEKLLLQALDIKEKSIGKKTPSFALSLRNLGLLYQGINEFEKAKIYLNEAYYIHKEISPKGNSEYTSITTSLSNSWHSCNNLDSAFFYCKKSIDLNIINPDTESPIQQINIAKYDFSKLEKLDYYNYNNLQRSLLVLSRLLHKKYQKTNDTIFLNQQYTVQKIALNIIEKRRNKLSFKSDKLWTQKRTGLLVEESIHTALLLDDKKHLSEIFSFVEQNKAMLLVDAIKKNKSYTLRQIPDSLSAKEVLLKRKLTKLNKRHYLAISEKEKNKITEELYLHQVDINSFLQFLKETYPKYSAIQYENNIVSLNQIQHSIDNQTTLLEYLITDSVTYLVSIQKETIELYPIAIQKKELVAKINAFRENLTNIDNLQKKPKETYDTFVTLASWFYNKLLKVSLENNNTKNLIIIPDGQLGYIPFDIFISTTSPKSSYNDYKALNYLMNQYNISYNYSATIWHENTNITNNNNNNKIIGFAPTYELKDSTILSHRSPYLKELRTSLSPLPEAQRELDLLSNKFEGKFLKNTAANEYTFKKEAKNYGVIHLALHGVLNKHNPMLSGLVLTENGDSIENNFLQSYEISNLDLNANLVVLSACETGYGKFEQGEGILSLAHSFMYAGTPSLIVSLWEVNDASTAIIMNHFYHYLTEGFLKSEALKLAKKEYLKKATGFASHPMFWSPFIQLGNDSPILLEKKQYNWFLVSIVSLFLVILLLILFYKKKP